VYIFAGFDRFIGVKRQLINISSILWRE